MSFTVELHPRLGQSANLPSISTSADTCSFSVSEHIETVRAAPSGVAGSDHLPTHTFRYTVADITGEFDGEEEDGVC